MSLNPGTRLGSFEILAPLGAGGMGEVYRASDRRLGREVAIKVLPEEFAADAMRLARFEREARLLASVNHPGLAVIYGIEEAGPIRYIVMELVEGETLAEKLATGALPLRDALSIARQIAEALEAAHEKGIIHRDLKPSNVKVTPEGKVKVLDLGLAKAMDRKLEGSDTSKSPTMVLDQTRPGVILGTVEFMSPEQARGKATDKRTDIWAFGCVLYEMLTGRRTFAGETVSDVLATILTAEPDWGALPADTPRSVRELLRRCLKKDANERLRDIGDARLELDQAHSGHAVSAPLPVERGRRSRSVLARAAVVFLILASGATVWLSRRRPPPARAGSPVRQTLAVLPFRDLSSPAGDSAMGDGLVETMSARLGRVPGVQVVTPGPGVVGSSRGRDPFLLARDYGADLFLQGAIQRENERVRITYAVWNRASREQIASGDVTGRASELFSIQDQLADRVCKELNVEPATVRDPPTKLTASQQIQYLEALGLLQRWDLAGAVDEAIAKLTAITEKTPDAALAHAALARALLRKYQATGDKAWANRAATSAGRAFELAPDVPSVRATRGTILTRTGKAQEGVAEIEKALSKEPSSFDLLLALAAAQQAAKRGAEAEATYRRTIALAPGSWLPYNSLGALYYEGGRFDEAATMFKQVVRLTPDNVRGWNNLGGAYHQMGEFEKARDAYTSSIGVRPSDGAYNNLGTTEYYLGRYSEAAKAFEEATKLTPGKALYWSNLGDAYRWTPDSKPKAAGAYDRAVSLAREALTVDPRDSMARLTVAVCLAKKGDVATARQELSTAIAADPEDPDTLYQAAVISHLDGKDEEAFRYLTAARQHGLATALAERDPELAALRGTTAFRDALGGRPAAVK